MPVQRWRHEAPHGVVRAWGLSMHAWPVQGWRHAPDAGPMHACLFRDGAMGLTLDPQLIRDLTVLIAASTVGGALFEAVRQPIINGYFIAGSLVGPGGLKLIKVRADDMGRPHRLALY